MDSSIADFELSASTVRVESDSDPNSEKSDNFEDILDPDMLLSATTEHKEEDDDFDSKLPETVTLLTNEATGAKVYLVGTAHFSQESKDDVAKVIRAVRPHVVMVELCDARTTILSMDEKTILEEAKNIDLDKIMATIKRNGAYYGITYILLLNLSAHLTKEIGMAPGGEFRVAYQEASNIPNCKVILGDRPIKITLLRALSKLSWFQTVKLAWHLLFSREPISKEEIEKCKRRDMLEQLLSEMAGEYPALGEVFVTERDIFLTHSLQHAARNDLVLRGVSSNQMDAEPRRVVGVVGIGHAIGIAKLWPHDQSAYISDIMFVPPPTVTSKIIKFAFKASLLTFGGYLIYRFVPIPKTVRQSCHSAFDNVVTHIKTF